MTRPTALGICALAVAGLIAGCAADDGGVDPNTAVPSGDPPFTALTDLWVVDNVGVLEPATVRGVHAVCQRLQDDGVAEVVVLIQNGVKHPAEYATHYGRWLKLGRKGLSGEGGNNGLVWLIRPDADLKMTYSVGRGLPRLTSGHMAEIMEAAKECFSFSNYDEGLRVLVRGTDAALRRLYGRKGASP